MHNTHYMFQSLLLHISYASHSCYTIQMSVHLCNKCITQMTHISKVCALVAQSRIQSNKPQAGQQPHQWPLLSINQSIPPSNQSASSMALAAASSMAAASTMAPAILDDPPPYKSRLQDSTQVQLLFLFFSPVQVKAPRHNSGAAPSIWL